MSIDINEYIDDWLQRVQNEKEYDGEIHIEDIKNKGRLENLSKKFKSLEFDKEWKQKLLSNKFVILGVDKKNLEKHLTLEMALYNCGYNIRECGLKGQILKYIKDLTQWEFLQLLDSYREQKSLGFFSGKWDPFGIKSKNEFIREFRSPHFTIEDDSIMISIVSEITQIDFIIFHQNYCIQDLSTKNKKLNDKIILLYKFADNDGNIYFCSIGHKNRYKTVKTIFERDNLPNDIKIILDKDEFIYHHIKLIIDNSDSKLTLDNIINKLETNLYYKFSHVELREIIKVINSILQDNDFFTKNVKS